MILVDSNIFIDYWRNPSDNATDVFKHNEIAVCGVVKTELLRGTKSVEQYEDVKKALECFEHLAFNESDWDQLAKLFITLKENGISIPFQDGIIAYLSIKNSCKLWTNDKHFKIIQAVVPSLQLL